MPLEEIARRDITMRDITRRDLIRGVAVSATALAFSRYVHAGSSEKIRVGLIGCGGRGTGAAEDCLTSSRDVELIALADVFPDRLESCRANLTDPNREGGPLSTNISPERCFGGFDGYKKLLALKEIDLVLLATPPGFRPLHFSAAIEAGKHVFMEKPVAVDASGVRQVLAAGSLASEKRLAVVSGTQRRHHAGYIETVKRIQDGAIGKVLSARCYWNQGYNWVHDRKAGETDLEWQLRNWLYFSWLSGDGIVEQHIHNIDVINWVMGAHPIRAVAVGGKQVRVEEKYGNCFDHFCVDYEYENGAHLTSMSWQIQGTDGIVGEWVAGSAGDAAPGGTISGPRAWKFSGQARNPYVQEHADLIASIRAGSPLNETKQVAESTMTAILGREAAYTGRTQNWDVLMRSEKSSMPNALAFGPFPAAPTPMPGKTAPINKEGAQ